MFSCFFRLPLWIICVKSSIVVYKSYSSDCMHCWQRHAQEHSMEGKGVATDFVLLRGSDS